MVSHVHTVAFQGIEAVPVNVQVMVAPGKMNIQIVGLPDKAVAESRERVQAALHASGLSMPVKKVTVNLAPADLPKEGSHYDLPIALGLMAALGAIPGDALDGFVVLGELSLDGTIAPVAGALPAAMGANALGKGLICPYDSGPEAAWAGAEIDILAPRSLIAIANHFRGTQVLSRPEAMIRQAPANLPDMADIKGQETAKRALEVAAAGGHNLLMVLTRDPAFVQASFSMDGHMFTFVVDLYSTDIPMRCSGRRIRQSFVERGRSYADSPLRRSRWYLPISSPSLRVTL